MTRLTSAAITFLILGIGSFILPLIGIQFKILIALDALTGGNGWLISLIFILIGAILFVIHLLNNKK